MEKEFFVYRNRWIADLSGVDLEIIRSRRKLFKTAIFIANELNFTIVRRLHHRWTPQGETGGLILAESHFIWHTWPERGDQLSIDIFSCAPNLNLDRLPELIIEHYKPEKVDIRMVDPPHLKPTRFFKKS